MLKIILQLYFQIIFKNNSMFIQSVRMTVLPKLMQCLLFGILILNMKVQDRHKFRRIPKSTSENRVFLTLKIIKATAKQNSSQNIVVFFLLIMISLYSPTLLLLKALPQPSKQTTGLFLKISQNQFFALEVSYFTVAGRIRVGN